MDEKFIEIQILNYLRSMGFFFFKVDYPITFVRGSGRVKRSSHPYVLNGVSDVIGVNAEGLFCALEVKTPKEIKYVRKHYDKLKVNCIENQRNKKKLRLYNQITFIES